MEEYITQVSVQRAQPKRHPIPCTGGSAKLPPSSKPHTCSPKPDAPAVRVTALAKPPLNPTSKRHPPKPPHLVRHEKLERVDALFYQCCHVSGHLGAPTCHSHVEACGCVGVRVETQKSEMSSLCVWSRFISCCFGERERERRRLLGFSFRPHTQG